MKRRTDSAAEADPFAGFERRQIALGGTRIRLLQRGSGRDLLFLHGAPGSLRDWEPVVDLLPPGCRITLVDRPGYGGSGPPSGRVDLESACAWTVALSKALGLERPLLVGHSYGASIALALAGREREEFSGFVCLAGPAFGYSGALAASHLLALPLFGDIAAVLAARLAPTWIFRRLIKRALGPDSEAVDGEFFTNRIREWRDAVPLRTMAREEVRLDGDLRRLDLATKRIEAPCAVVQGECDCYVSVDEARRLQAALSCARLYLAPQSGHYLQFGRPELVATAIAGVLSSACT